MLDEQEKPRLGTLLDEARAHWRAALTDAMAAQGVAALGASAELLPHIPRAGIGQTVLAERVGLSKQAVQQFLDQLEPLGLIRREPDPTDRRAKRVVLTEAGGAALAARRVAEREAERQLRGRLGRKLFARTKKGLKRLSAGSASTPG